MNLILIGYRGTGKSSVGRNVAGELNRKFVDLDVYIEENQGKSIKEIFDEGGEGLFREIETAAIKELKELDNMVMAPGGGAVLCDTNVKNLKQNGFVILLEADDLTIDARLSHDIKSRTQRPTLLDGKSQLEEIKAKQAERRPVYKKTADAIINTSSLSIEDVCKKVVLEFNNHVLKV